MLPLLTKPLEQLVADDVQALVREGFPEGERVEFKECLPVRIEETCWLVEAVC